MRYRGILTSKQTRGQHEIGPSGGLGAVPNLWLPQLRALVAFSFTQGLAVRFRLHGMQYLERAGHGAGTARQRSLTALRLPAPGKALGPPPYGAGFRGTI
jgi:hypothetical protein